MNPSTRTWSGDTWEEYCLQLLSMHYGHSQFQRLPPSTGDLGIEGYSRDGCLYQCYAPDDAPSSLSPYEKLRRKLTEDLSKLEKNQGEFKCLLGNLKIDRYVFMVPSFDRRIVEHAAKKSSEIRRKSLPFLSSNFEIHVVSDQDFPHERAALASAAAIRVNVAAPDVTEDQLGTWQSKNASLVETLDKKLEKVPTLLEVSDRTSMRAELLGFYLRGEDLMQKLRSEYPATWEKLYTTKNSRERILVASNRLRKEEAHDRLTRTIQEVRVEFNARAKEIGDELAEQLAWYAAADWLTRCPLRFD